MEPLIVDPDPDPGFMKVELRVPSDGRDLGLWLAIEGPNIGAVRAPGFEVFESEGATGKEIILAGAPTKGSILEFHVPDRRLGPEYRVRLIQVTGDDYAPRDVSAYTARISR
ncbi:hypothetical protein [Candidatus Palauibacter sp.]|uniref:hypothetical protein n=1 Tax=Candidatus Palauibacter sp. TaxID=3101350 RepID=UPI003B5214AF